MTRAGDTTTTRRIDPNEEIVLKSLLNPQRNAPQWTQVLTTLAEHWPLSKWCDVGVVIGCSGGADSVALLVALAELRQRQAQLQRADGFLVVAHYNHALRGAESDGDQAFVRQLAERFALRLVTERADGDATDEATLREQRHRFLLSVAKRCGARYVAVAHTVDDNVETVLHHLMRGTGPRGVAGIAPSRSLDRDFVLVRPMLAIRRETLRGGLAEIGQAWREDSSNQDLDYRRNWIRRALIPMIQSEYPDAVAAIGRAVDRQRQWRETIDRQATVWLEQHLLAPPEISLYRDSESQTAIVVVALQLLWDRQKWPRGEMSHAHWTRLANSVQGGPPERYSLPSAIDVLAESDRVTIRPQNRDQLPAD